MIQYIISCSVADAVIVNHVVLNDFPLYYRYNRAVQVPKVGYENGTCHMRVVPDAAQDRTVGMDKSKITTRNNLR